MGHFLQAKILHGAATVPLLGGLLGLALYAWHGWRTDDTVQVTHSFKRVRPIGWLLPGLSLLALPVSDWWLVYLAGWPSGQNWLLFGAYLYLLGCIFWLVLVDRLARAQYQASAAETTRTALSEQTPRETEVDLVMALLGTASFVVAAVLMVSRPF